MPNLIMIGLCTCQRPILLRACLNSLARQEISSEFSVEIVVVDNEAEPNNKAGVEDFANTCPFPVHYVHEPRRGIAIARNAILDKAIALNADWIAMLDDDETAEPDWLAKLMVPKYREDAIVFGFNIPKYPENSKWIVRGKSRAQAIEGDTSAKPSAGNVRISRTVIQSIRFNEAMGYMPGEDIDFFVKAREKGFTIRRTLEAITYETLHERKLTYFGQMKTKYGQAVAIVKLDVIKNGTKSAFFKYTPDIIKNLLISASCLPLILIWLPFNEKQYRRYALKSGRKFATMLGYCSGLAGRDAKTYAKISGY